MTYITKEKIQQLSMKQIENRLFIYDSSKADEMYFRSCLWQFLQGHIKGQGYFQFLREIVWKANDEGKTIKYLHFNERAQKVYLDWLFEEWAKRVCDEMKVKLSKILTV